MKRVVFDASALMAFFEARPGAEKVKELIGDGADGKSELMMSVVNWGEVYYSIWHQRGREAAELKLKEIIDLPIEIVGADKESTRLAAEIKAKYRLPYADCFAASLAKSRDATVLTTDADFLAVKDSVAISFI